jgi:hypothetical protein
MQDTILHSGALTVSLDSQGEATSAIAGRLPSLDQIARERAIARYLTSAPDSLFSEHYSTDTDTTETGEL